MKHTAIINILLVMLIGASSQAQMSNVLRMASPKLRNFLMLHPVASSALSNTIAEAFPHRAVELYYFYTEDESVSRAWHYYPDESSVGIVIRENQSPCDECICLIFELVNSEGEEQFQKLAEAAKSGTVTKTNFVSGILRREFKAEMKTRNLLNTLKLSKKEQADSYFYGRLMNEPTNFQEALIYKEKESPDRGLIKYYEQEYDNIREFGLQAPVSQPTPISPSVLTNK